VSTVLTPQRKAPWHLRVVAVVALLWNSSGAYTIMMAQAGRLYDLEPGEAAYYAAQPVWFVALTDIALVAAIAAALALLLRKSMAVWLFALSLTAIVITNGYEFATATSRALLSRGALIVTVIIILTAIFELAYARAMQRRAALRPHL
jgi:hypothetical protein